MNTLILIICYHSINFDLLLVFKYIFLNKNKLAIWDLRNFNNRSTPISFIEEPRAIKKVQFCPAKADRLGLNFIIKYNLESGHLEFIMVT